MRIRLKRLWEKLRYSYWFVPTVMAAVAIGLAYATMAADQAISDRWLLGRGVLYPYSADGTRALLSTIAGSMITVAGVVFSITIVALSLASQQMGPRILRNFMRDAGNQCVLGTFIATFLYCLLVLRTIHESDRQTYVPHLSVAFGVGLALCSLGVLIYFIHHVSVSIQAPYVIETVGKDLVKAIDDLYPVQLGHEPPPEREARLPQEIPPGFDRDAAPILSDSTGYLQAIDGHTLLAAARENDLLLQVEVRPGDFVIAGRPLVTVWPPAKADEKLAARVNFAFIVGGHRTSTQDVEFALDQLVEVACRALSPAINDPFTAIACVDWLSAGLFELSRRPDPSPYRLDAHGKLRIITTVSRFQGLVDAAFNQLRQKSRDDVAVTCRLLEAIFHIAHACRDDQFRLVLAEHATLIAANSRDWPEARDRNDVQERYQRVLQRLGQPPVHQQM